MVGGGCLGVSLFGSPGEIVRALKRYRDCYDPATTSLMAFGGPSDPHGEPFRKGFIANFEERAELARRLNTLGERERRLLVLWHVEGHPVARIGRMLGISRVHCYRLQKIALEAMTNLDGAPGSEPRMAGATA
jgi:DNA-directed RNA polymerase specialized sigma24 family protein